MKKSFVVFFAAFKVSIESSEATGDFVTYKAKVEGAPLKKGKYSNVLSYTDVYDMMKS